MLYNITPFYSMQFCSYIVCIFHTRPNKVYYITVSVHACNLFFLFNRYNLLLVHCDILNFQTKNYFKYEENFYRIIIKCWVEFLSCIFKVQHFLRVWAGSEKFHVRIWRTNLSPKCPVRSNSKFILLYLGSLQH